MAHPTHHDADRESVLRVRYLADTNPEFALLVTDRPVHTERIADVDVAAVAEGPIKVNSRLNRRKPAVPWNLFGHDPGI